MAFAGPRRPVVVLACRDYLLHGVQILAVGAADRDPDPGRGLELPPQFRKDVPLESGCERAEFHLAEAVLLRIPAAKFLHEEVAQAHAWPRVVKAGAPGRPDPAAEDLALRRRIGRPQPEDLAHDLEVADLLGGDTHGRIVLSAEVDPAVARPVGAGFKQRRIACLSRIDALGQRDQIIGQQHGTAVQKLAFEFLRPALRIVQARLQLLNELLPALAGLVGQAGRDGVVDRRAVFRVAIGLVPEVEKLVALAVGGARDPQLELLLEGIGDRRVDAAPDRVRILVKGELIEDQVG